MLLRILLARSLFTFTAHTTPDIYTLSVHDALPIWGLQNIFQRDIFRLMTTYSAAMNHLHRSLLVICLVSLGLGGCATPPLSSVDRKSTRLNSSHRCISYAVFCLKKKITTQHDKHIQ